MQLFRPHGHVYVQVPQMASNLIFYRVWVLILPIPALASCGLGGVAGALLKTQPSNVLDTQASCFFLEKVHMFPSLSVITMYLQKLSMTPLTSLARFNSVRYFCFPNLIPGCSDNIQFLCIPPRVRVLASTLCRLPFYVWVFQEMLFPSSSCPGFFFLVSSLLEWRMCLCSLTFPDKYVIQ